MSLDYDERFPTRVVNVLFDDRIAGPSKRVVDVGRRLRQHSVETLVCLPEGSGEAEELAVDAGLRVRRVAFRRIPRPSDPSAVLDWIVSMPGDVRRFARAFRHENADVIHVNGAFFLAPALAAKYCGLPLVWHLNDTIVSREIAWALGRVVQRLADRVIVAAEAVARHYRIDRVPYEVVYAPVDGEQFVAPKRSAPFLSDGRVRVGCVANWYPAKGIEYFVRACALLRESLGADRVEVVLVGAKLTTQREYCSRVEALIDAL